MGLGSCLRGDDSVLLSMSDLPANVEKALRFLRENVPQNSTIILFGSRAGRNRRPNADFDIGIAAEEPLPWRTFARLKTDVEELAWPYRIDLVDLRRDPTEFLDVVVGQFIVLLWRGT